MVYSKIIVMAILAIVISAPVMAAEKNQQSKASEAQKKIDECVNQAIGANQVKQLLANDILRQVEQKPKLKEFCKAQKYDEAAQLLIGIKSHPEAIKYWQARHGCVQKLAPKIQLPTAEEENARININIVTTCASLLGAK